MQVPYNWLKTYIDFPYSPFELSDKLTMAGLEVEEVDYLGEGLENIIIGEIIEIKDHPNADKLKICRIDIKEKTLQMITGAPNIKMNIKVPIAGVGVTLPTGMEIEKTTIRGEISEGMICSKDELGLQEKRASGIMVLSDQAKKGEKFIKYQGLDEYVYKLDLTPNYARCLGMIGVAREVKAMQDDDLSIKYPKIDINETKDQKTDQIAEIKIDDENLCPRYAGLIIKDVKIKPSPKWIQNRLRAAGIRPINNIVDITNYVLLEYNQPLHAFDLNKIKDNKIIVRRAKEKESVTTLDGVERCLDEQTLVITDPQKIIAIAGVMGAANSEVTENTTDIFLEAAYFNPTNIRKTARKLALPSEASHRFERGIDIENVVTAGRRAAFLMQEYAEGQVLVGVIDNYPLTYQENIVKVEISKINRLLGISLDKDEIEDMLNRLKIETIKKEKDCLKFKVPSYRNDIKEDADIIEEVARIYGYNNIFSTIPRSNQVGTRTRIQKIEKKIKNVMNATGLDEIITFSLTGSDDYRKLDLPLDHRYRDWVSIKNPLNKDFGLLRTSLIPGLIEAMSTNAKRQIEELKYFEIGRVFFNQGKNERPLEKTKLSAGSMGSVQDRWDLDAPDFYYLKGVLEEFFKKLNIDKNIKYLTGSQPFYHPGRAADIFYKDKKIGILGELKQEIIEQYDLKERSAVLEIDLMTIFEEVEIGDYLFEMLPKYPAVVRDLAVMLSEDIPMMEVLNLINSQGQDILKDTELFDIYQGEQIPKGKKSIAFKLLFQAKDRTLTDQEVNSVVNQIIEKLKNKYEAEIRKK
ncbi:MAG: phenylalanine--tRNA ligase subunit beta [Halanaerobiales bacterium]|nr:phenylalanine--tRNA ligase subunit beta [Halanaerobiales bacterium]